MVVFYGLAKRVRAPQIGPASAPWNELFDRLPREVEQCAK
jgi:hypothetical protein